MKYVLTVQVIPKPPDIDLNKSEYESIKKSKIALAHGIAIEEKYEILLLNYLDFEEEILAQSAQWMIRHPCNYEDFFPSRLGFNRRLVNLLTATRLYIDQLHRHVKATIPENPDAEKTVKNLFSKEYDRNLEYRFMEALRNHVQHQGMPVHRTEVNYHKEDSEGQTQLVYSVELASKKEFFRENPSFKKKVLDEIPEEVDLKLATRVYVEAISRVHATARKLIEQSLEESRTVIKNAIASYREVFSGKFSVLNMVCLDDGKAIENIPLLLDWDDIRLKLVRRNSELVNLRRRYVSSRAKTYNKIP